MKAFMDFPELVKKRCSVRNYDTAPVSREKINLCLEAARLAPSACNSQPWKFIVVDDPELKSRVASAAFQGILDFNHFAFKAPVLVFIVSERQKLTAKFGAIVKRKNFSQMDIAIAAEHFCLQAAELELGTCMIGWFSEKKIKQILGIPKLKRIELAITLGSGKDNAIPAKKRKSTDQIAGYNRYD